jgi:hypothetical protein
MGVEQGYVNKPPNVLLSSATLPNNALKLTSNARDQLSERGCILVTIQ